MSKTDLVRYLRCPYSFWLLATDQIEPRELIDDLGSELISEGRAFEATLRQTATPLEVKRVEDVFNEHVRVFQSQRFDNQTLMITGVPDGIDTAGGALLPIEMKAHQDVQKRDKLELAFYWLLLDPYRTRKVDPHGFLLLRDRRATEPREVLVELTDYLLKEVTQLILEVRRTKSAIEILPEICDCAYCRLHKAEIEAGTPRSDLTRIFGIGRSYSRHLQSIGIRSLKDLKTCDPEAVAESMRARNWGITSKIVRSWVRHVDSYDSNHPVVFESQAVPERYIALDCEYLPSHIWLIGGAVVDGSTRSDFGWWADTTEQEGENLDRLRDLIVAHSGYPLLTWNGLSADLPHIRAALQRCGRPQSFLDSHLDLYQLACRSIRLPLTGFKLKDVATYFGIGRDSSISDGREAEGMYLAYLATSDKAERDRLKSELSKYNSDDIDTLIKAADRFRTLCAGTS